jgi:hypothetical protein
MRDRYFNVSIVVVLITIFIGFGEAQEPFVGYWRTSFGHLSLVANGKEVKGTYSDGKVQGRVRGRLSDDGKILAASWYEGSLEGKVVLKIQDGGNSFIGKWGRDDELLNGSWIGVRESSNSITNAVRAEDFTGLWETNFGLMEIVQDSAGKLSGNFTGQVNNGTVSGYLDGATGQFKFNWQDEKFAGTGYFQMLKGKNGLYGEWWYRSKKYGGSWYGVRKESVLGAIEGDCDNGKGVYVWTNGSRYEGEWKNGLQNGVGKLYASDGSLKQSGLWVNGQFRGKILGGNVQNGIGKIETPERHIYEGEFQNYLPQGRGKITYANGNIYEGEIKNGLPNGNGELTLAGNLGTYTGGFRDGIAEGRGTLVYSDSTTYEGYFRKGVRHGSGVLMVKDLFTYRGNWRNDLPNGRGTLRYANGDVYQGEFADGKRHGQGQYVFADGRMIAAKWENDNIAAENQPIVAEYAAAIAPSVGIPELPEVFHRRAKRYLVYQTKEIGLKQSGQPLPTLNAQADRELVVSLHIIEAPESVPEDEIRKVVGVQNLFGEQYVVKAVVNPVEGIERVCQQNRIGLKPTRILIVEKDSWLMNEDGLTSLE